MAAHASTITFLSLGTVTDPNQTNSTGMNTIPIGKHPFWADPLAGSQWVSYGSTGDPTAPGYFVVANGTIVTFTQTFFLNGTPLAGSLELMADDSTSVILNGMLLLTEPSQSLFRSPTAVNLTPALHSGLNTLQFQVQQLHMASFGLDYSGSASSTAAPEPSSVALFGFGLAGLSLVLARRRPKP